MANPDEYMKSPVSDSDRLEAIFEQVRSIRTILMFWSVLIGIGLAINIFVALGFR